MGSAAAMALMKVRGVWRDLGFGHQPDMEGPSFEADSVNLTKEEHTRLSAFLNRHPQEQQVRKWGLSPASIHSKIRRDAGGRFA